MECGFRGHPCPPSTLTYLLTKMFPLDLAPFAESSVSQTEVCIRVSWKTIKHRLLGPTPRDFHSGGLIQAPKICIPEFPGNADAAGPRDHTLRASQTRNGFQPCSCLRVTYGAVELLNNAEFECLLGFRIHQCTTHDADAQGRWRTTCRCLCLFTGNGPSKELTL